MSIVNSVSYGGAGQVLAVSGNNNSGYAGETRTYNDLLQLLTVSGGGIFGPTVSMQYTYQLDQHRQDQQAKGSDHG